MADEVGGVSKKIGGCLPASLQAQPVIQNRQVTGGTKCQAGAAPFLLYK